MSVLQDWLEEIPLRMQSTLILSLRGPDTHACPHIKAIQRWMRGLVFKPGNPDNVAEFMGAMPDPIIKEKSVLAKELEFCSQHFYSHLMHGLQVIGFRYPNKVEAATALSLYMHMCFLMHLIPEDKLSFENRLCERQWPGGKQPNDFSEAMELLKSEEQADGFKTTT